jgi:hypothetical protein
MHLSLKRVEDDGFGSVRVMGKERGVVEGKGGNEWFGKKRGEGRGMNIGSSTFFIYS